MTNERFEAMVGRLEHLAAESPGAYRLRVAALTALGFGYVLGILLVAAGLLAGIVWAYGHGTGRVALRKGGIAIAYLMYAIGRALWVRFERPTGTEIRREQAPALFAAIDETRRALRAPRVHRVLLENDLNAAVIQHPRLGILGWHENVLFLGLPLLQSLDEAQFRAVLAHEFGHLSGAHSRFGGWIQRLEATWRRLLSRLEEEEHWSTFIFRPFFRWYSPYFAAYTFVLRRANELEADRDASELTSARALGDALVSLNLKGTDLEHRFWPGVRELVGERAKTRSTGCPSTWRSAPPSPTPIPASTIVSRPWTSKRASRRQSKRAPPTPCWATRTPSSRSVSTRSGGPAWRIAGASTTPRWRRNASAWRTSKPRPKREGSSATRAGSAPG
jgi:Zn-dependent protease with chaperone function